MSYLFYETRDIWGKHPQIFTLRKLELFLESGINRKGERGFNFMSLFFLLDWVVHILNSTSLQAVVSCITASYLPSLCLLSMQSPFFAKHARALLPFIARVFSVSREGLSPNYLHLQSKFVE